ncbi:histidine kinase N-terminal 7TM domain-containing protein [Natronosalvus vescus]|uniref:histidine kinase N-terminal 7TM domain-containing protein n=1 Tax=Natronosalvus vescus TaxID=2953881 RepID=UPI002090F7CD|nr:histidine kinase N-terminal 7TM domain-containing protein [Natronosalvus vescus]
MVLEEFHFRVAYLIAAAGVLFLLRRPLRYPNRPGSKWFAVTIVATSLWLCCVGLYYFVHSLTGSLILYTTVQFVITICFISWFLVAVEFATGRRPARSLILFLAALAVIHFVVLWTNFFWVHDLAYRSNAWVDNTGGIRIAGGPLYWVHIVSMYVLVFISTTLYVSQWASSSGLRRRQAAILAMTPAVGVGANLLLLLDVGLLGFDPTPIGVIVGVVLMGWALYRTEFLDVTPVARQTVVERMADAVVIIDDRNRVVDWNRAALELFDVDDPVAGMAPETFFHAVSSETLEVVVETKRAEAEIAFERNGRRRHASVSIDPVEGDTFEPLGRVIVARDVTGIKRREQQLIKQNEYLDEFAGIVSHDMQGPLMQIRVNTDLARKTEDVSRLDLVFEATDRMRHLLEDLLDLARTGHQIDDLEPVDLADLATNAWSRVWTPDAELVVETDDTVLADPDRLQQLLENIFRNSVEHGSVDDRPQVGDRSLAMDQPSAGDRFATGMGVDMKEDGMAGSDDGDPTADGMCVRIGSLADGFFVEDDGTGIQPELRLRIFDRGYSTSEDGTGLGLSIVSHIAGAHGWAVCATEGAHGGARFEITGVDTVERATPTNRN